MKGRQVSICWDDSDEACGDCALFGNGCDGDSSNLEIDFALDAIICRDWKPKTAPIEVKP